MGFYLLIALAGWGAAHVHAAARLRRRGGWRRALVALLVPPLAPWWAWRSDLRKTAVAWGVALALYAAGVAVTGC